MSKKLLQAAAGNAGEALYVEDVFSTYLYTGNGSTQTITNGIDLSGEGGLVWIKSRSNATSNRLCDTERGATKLLSSNETSGETAVADTLTAFNSDGFTLGADTGNWGINLNSTYSQTSWTFRKAPKFFDVVTYTGDGVAGRTVAHNLEVAPAFIIIKCTSTPTNWPTYHASDDGAGFGDENTNMYLNLTLSTQAGSSFWNGTAPTSTEFTVGSSTQVNGSGETYVAYLFASDAGGFGDDGSENIIKCGSYTGDGTSDHSIEVGFEPQWLLIKNTSLARDWVLSDSMRGLNLSQDYILRPNTSAVEANWAVSEVTATGFRLTDGDDKWNTSGDNFIYIAIRRPMKTPESGTEVFKANYVDNGASFPDMLSGFPVDMYFRRYVNTTNNPYWFTRLLGTSVLDSTSTGAEQTFSANSTAMDSNVGVMNIFSTNNTDFYGWMFKRATGFFDVVAYTGTSSVRTVAHNLGVTPELLIFKRRDSTFVWRTLVFNGSSWTGLILNNTGAASTGALPELYGDDTTFIAPTDTVFTVGASATTNVGSMIAYLFATLAGVSKVFSVTKSSGSNANVDCGFSAGARFILLKRTDSTGDWYVWDSVRGIVSGNDPYLLLNSTAAEVTTTDYIDPLASGFTIVDGGLANGDYIGLAIA